MSLSRIAVGIDEDSRDHACLAVYGPDDLVGLGTRKVNAKVRTISKLIAIILTVLVLKVYADAWPSFDLYKADFAAFYSTALLWREGQPSYDAVKACELQKAIGVPSCMATFHPPILLPLTATVVNDNYVASYWRWCAALLLLVLLCAVPVYALTHRDAIKTIALLCFFPVFRGVLQGQDTVVVLFAILLCVLFLKRGKDLLAGVALGLTVLRPPLAIAFGIAFLFSRRKAFVSFCVTASTLAVFSFLLVGAQGFRDIISTAILSANGAHTSTHQQEMFNLVGIFVRAGLRPEWAWPMFLAAIIGVAILWRKRGVTHSTFALAMIAFLLTSPHLHSHDLALLVIPLIAWPSVTVPLISLAMLAATPLGAAPLVIYVIMSAMLLTIVIRRRAGAAPIPLSS